MSRSALSSTAMAIAADIKLSYPPELPVSARRDDLLRAIGDHQVVIVAGQTGSGKTTQLPKICLELGRSAIAHTQPRRIAARTVATRIAEELGVQLGGTVGYAVRFDDRSDASTLVRLVTDGLLLAEIQRDRLLRRYDTIILDEAHERSLNIDFLLGYLKQLLPQRPDLKLVITSATIDTGRFSEHFGGAPVVEVSGRTYPVEVRYRPVVDEDDPVDAIGDAVEELLHDAPGDVLVFLSGEREIRDTAEALAGRLPQGTGILPLYARLSPAEQQRVFSRHSERRVVLATNVAETSLTVPGIGAVVDPGSARISRYSARLKVQRLPIEPISQASANQRMGRCGRTSDGICIRLYSEQDFLDRPAFTDPEILRTSLAAVILQMEALGLGEIEDFGFLDPPDRRQIRDGKALLHELGALNLDAERPGARLTALGRRLAQLPVDPRIGRMVLEADRAGCADEVVIIAAALSIQDPRIRPAEKRGEADERHARFKDERSDFLAHLNLWRHLRAQQKELSRSGFRKMCHADFLHYMRVREWQDLAGQLRQAARNVGVTINQEPAAPDDVHRALLAGLLSHVGLRDGGRREYDGARGARFTLSPGSALARKQPTWVMVAELVETNRLWGHTAAQIQPRWIEPLAGHLLKRTYAEPHWERKRASVVATERATLYGVPVVRRAHRALRRDRPRCCRASSSSVTRCWRATGARSTPSCRTTATCSRRSRSSSTARGGATSSRPSRSSMTSTTRGCPSTSSRARTSTAGGRPSAAANPGLLTFTRELLVGDNGIDERALPDTWRQGADRRACAELSLRARRARRRRHGPCPAERAHGGARHRLRLARAGPARGARHGADPLAAQGAAPPARADPRDGCAGRRRPAAAPRRARRRGGARARARARHARRPRISSISRGCPPICACASRLRTRTARRSPPARTSRRCATSCGPGCGRSSPRPPRATSAAACATGRSASCRAASRCPGTGDGVVAYPALVDEGATVGVRAFESAAAQAGAMQAGTRRLLALTVPSPLRAVRRGLGATAALTLAGAPHGGAGSRARGRPRRPRSTRSSRAAADRPGTPRASPRCASTSRQGVAATTEAIVRDAVEVLDAAAQLRARLEAISPDPALQPARLDVAAQLGGLVHPGFIAATGAERLPQVVRYLRGAVRRLDRLPDAVAADRDRMNAIGELERQYAARGGRAAAPAVHWMLQELRVAQFAQGLGVQGTGSAKQIRARSPRSERLLAPTL